MSTKFKIQKRGHSFYLQHKENYVPFSNLSLCPKAIIALVQSQFDQDDLDRTLAQLRTPTTKHHQYLSRMRTIADKQEKFLYNDSLMDTATHESEHSYFKEDPITPPPFYEDYYK